MAQLDNQLVQEPPGQEQVVQEQPVAQQPAQQSVQQPQVAEKEAKPKKKTKQRTNAIEDYIFPFFIDAGTFWFSFKLWYLDALFTLMFFAKVNWLPQGWSTGYNIFSIGTVSIWFLIPAIISTIQWYYFPFTVDFSKLIRREWPMAWRMIRGRKLNLYEIGFWLAISFFNFGTTFTMVVLYIVGDPSTQTEGINVIPIWFQIVLPTAGAGLFIVGAVASFILSQGPEFFARRALSRIAALFAGRL
jgi:hypothetical protein